MKKKQQNCFINFHFIIHSLKTHVLNIFKKTDTLYELQFYDELSIKEVLKAFKRYARSYKSEIIDSKDP